MPKAESGLLKILCLLVLVASGSRVSLAETLSHDEYLSIRNTALLAVGEELKDTVVLGPGKSPATLVQFLKLLPGAEARAFPLSRFRHRPGGAPAGILPDDEYLSELRPLTPKEEATLFAHFDRFIPTDEELRGRSLTLLDYAQSGYSLFGVTLYLRRYLRLRGRSTPVRVVAVTVPKHLERLEQAARLAGIELKVVEVDPRSQYGRNLDWQRYEHFAEYGSFEVTSPDPNALIPRADGNVELGDALRKSFLTDQELRHPEADLVELHQRLLRYEAIKGSAPTIIRVEPRPESPGDCAPDYRLLVP